MTNTEIAQLIGMCKSTILNLSQTTTTLPHDIFDQIKSVAHACLKNGEIIADIEQAIPLLDRYKFKSSATGLLRVVALSSGPGSNQEVINDLSFISKQLQDILSNKPAIKFQNLFYSRQSGLPNRTNRSFIQKCIEKALDRINSSNSDTYKIQLDSDIRGLPGSPDIINAILKKIDNSFIFVADVSIIDNISPNPNVMLELGYALKSLGDERIVMVMNSAFGEIQDLPFDLGLKRQLCYCLAPEDQDKTIAKETLTAALERAIRTVCDKCTSSL